MIKQYYLLIKPGIIFGNGIPAIAGFFLASKGQINLILFFVMLVGLSLVIASACVINNYIDRNIDKKMVRTKNRALAANTIPVISAILSAVILGIAGFSLLFFYTNLLTAFLAFIGFFFYVVMYSIWKRKSSFGTVVGSISGAIPPVVGYCAVTNNFDIGALLLFLILVFWQMPHFYAIAIFRSDDYAAAGIPVLPVEKDLQTTQVHMLLYILAFLVATVGLYIFGLTGFIYLVIALVLGLYWLFIGTKGFTVSNTHKWARKMFGISLLVLTILCAVITIDSFFHI